MSSMQALKLEKSMNNKIKVAKNGKDVTAEQISSVHS